jgi:hypothetical protein
VSGLAVSESPAPDGTGRPAGARAITVAGATLVVFLGIGVALIWRLVDEERARDIAGWQSRLGLVADDRAAALTDWVERQMTEVKAVAENESVQLYMSELTAAALTSVI